MRKFFVLLSLGITGGLLMACSHYEHNLNQVSADAQRDNVQMQEVRTELNSAGIDLNNWSTSDASLAKMSPADLHLVHQKLKSFVQLATSVANASHLQGEHSFDTDKDKIAQEIRIAGFLIQELDGRLT